MLQRLAHRGFTLIELLVVIAIIGILAAVVLASLNDARQSGSDAAIQQSLGNARSQAEIVYNQAGAFSYEGVCEDSQIIQLVNAAADGTGAAAEFDDTDVADDDTAVCHDDDQDWVIQAPLATQGTWCVDSTGNATRTASFVGNGDMQCP